MLHVIFKQKINKLGYKISMNRTIKSEKKSVYNSEKEIYTLFIEYLLHNKLH